MSLSEKLIELAESGFKVSFEYEPKNQSYIFRISKLYYEVTCARVYKNIFTDSDDDISYFDHKDLDFDSVFLEALNMAEKTWNDFYKRGGVNHETLS